MSVKLVHRPARTTAPDRQLEPFTLDAPPPMEKGKGGMNMMSLVPLLGAGVSMTVMMLFRGSSLAAIGALMMIVTVLASIVMLLSQRGRQGRVRREQRENYLDYLERSRAQLRREEQQAARVARVGSPPPGALFDIVRNPQRLWERRRANEDFLEVRLGTGARKARDIRVADAGSALQQGDAFMTTELEILKRRYESSPDLPVTVPLDSAGTVSVVGSRSFVLAVARNLVLQSCAFHSPEDLHLALAAGEDSRTDWEWAGWLPHLADQRRTHKTGPVRRFARSVDELSDLLAEDLHSRSTQAAEARKNYLAGGVGNSLPRLLAVSDSYGALPAALHIPDQQTAAGALGITTVYLVADRGQEPGEVSLRITEDDDGGFLLENYRQDPLAPVRERGTLDELPVATAAALARELAPLRLSPDSLEHDSAASSVGFLDMLGLSPQLDAADIRRLWQPRSEVDFLRVPLGPDDRGRPAMLDLKESAQFGMGPHGLCVGATGSGKSEMLRSLVLGLLATHSPDVLAMVLVDYKGGATFAPFAGAPQVAGVITNLSDDVSLIERVYASLAGEIQRRQEVLKAAGNLANITDYQLHRREAEARGEDLPPLPHLVVIVDEFGELLTARPDFIELFLSIGRIGRSIGVHLLLSSQRIEGGKLRGLETYLSYRIGLRTLSESESRTVLDTPDAFHLPPVPGFGYLKVDTTTYTRFKAGYVSGPLESLEEPEDEPEEQPEVLPAPRYAATLEDAATAARRAAPLSTAASQRTTGPTVLSTLMETLSAFPRSVEPIWLPPLPRGAALDTVAEAPLTTSQGIRLPAGGNLRVPVGLLDDPARQWQGVWELDLTSAGGNVAITGGPHSGKSTALRTIAASLALTHSPAEVGIYAVDLLGSSLLPLEGLPHVGGVAVRTNREVVRRTVEEIMGMLRQREELFERYNVDSLPTLRRLCAQGRIPELGSADVVLLLDGYGQLADEFEDIEKTVHALISRGGGYGIHVIATSTRMNEVRIAQQSFFGTRIELRLGDPAESAHGRKLAESISAERPGRALTERKLLGHFALPRIDGDDDPDTAVQGLRDLVAAVAASTDSRAMQVRVLPPLVPAGSGNGASRRGMLPLGLRETDLGTEQLDLEGRDRHLVVLGDDGCGKTNLLRTVIRNLTEQYASEDLVFAVFDPRRTLADEVPDAYLGGHATSAARAEQLATAVAGELAERVSDPQKAAAAPKVVLLIDDYDILTAGGSSPLGRLTQYLPLGAEIGLHAVLTRRVRGASRGLYEAFFTALRDSGSTGLLMSGDRSEGALINGARARLLPPGRAQLLQAGRPAETVQLFFNEPAAEPGRDLDRGRRVEAQ
ncbi:type VII secretion protein EccCa [Paenarthrobacter sp. DKR-5]|uniref:type VII secretion protein EccCa n=1 Tax=Paenarthrobacter sp. DKR-5 TaxID=2835535 RepID=UPI001BDCB1F0|nr:type VII secretion protein EccCa [Paenarthrobacter sp. DKR-5]MBT1002549.1 type VII secretion protein EccCa [Paenarthrobacter sp. DKR-5]